MQKYMDKISSSTSSSSTNITTGNHHSHMTNSPGNSRVMSTDTSGVITEESEYEIVSVTQSRNKDREFYVDIVKEK